MGYLSSHKKSSFLFVGMLAASSAFALGSANATNGYFSHGYGASSKGLAGAGVALNLDSMAAATNPASMVHVGNRFDVEVGAFMPDRTILGNGSVSGAFTSRNKFFLIPQIGVNVMLDENSSIGVTMSANGGMNSDYEVNPFSAFGAGSVSGKSATDAPAGVDLAQSLIGLTYARKYGNHSIGITPTLAMQRFKAEGLQSYEQISSATNALYGNGYDYSVGYGIRLGYQGKVTDSVTVGAAFASEMDMTKFTKYEGLFANQGEFDIPANFTLGVAVEIPDTGVTVAADFQYVMYDGVDAVSNTGAGALTTCTGAHQLGGDEGCGFGWNNQKIFKLGVQYAASDNLVLRAGASHNSKVYEDNEALFNILAPAVVRTHLSFGGTYALAHAHMVNFSYTQALNADQTLTHPNQGAGSTIKHSMSQHDVTVGYTYKW